MNRAALALLLVGLTQMIGDLWGVSFLEGVGAATMISPAPKVFSAVQRYETYSTRFELEYMTIAGETKRLKVTPEVYSQLRGPYNRRNAYGAIVAYGPVLASDDVSAPMFRSVARYGVCKPAPLLGELGIDPAKVKGVVRLRYVPRAGVDMSPLPEVLEIQCDR